MSIALYIGRFQPLHKGHLEYIKQILAENDTLKIVIGSAQETNTKKNPFSAEERVQMLKNCIPDIEIYTARDYPGENNKWLKNIKNIVGSFDILYSGENKLVTKIFTEAGYKVETLKRIAHISSTKIRKLVAQNKEWKHLVPECAYNYIKDIDGETRIRKIYIT